MLFKYGRTTFILAAQNGHKNIFNNLIEAKANVNIQAKEGCTTLILAYYNGHSDIVKYLKEANADVNMQAEESHTAQNGHSDIKEYLIEANADFNFGFILFTLSAKTVTYYHALFYRLEKSCSHYSFLSETSASPFNSSQPIKNHLCCFASFHFFCIPTMLDGPVLLWSHDRFDCKQGIPWFHQVRQLVDWIVESSTIYLRL